MYHRETWPELEPILQAALADADPSIRTAALTFTEAYTKALSELIVEESDLVCNFLVMSSSLSASFTLKCHNSTFSHYPSIKPSCTIRHPMALGGMKPWTGTFNNVLKINLLPSVRWPATACRTCRLRSLWI